MFVQEQPPGHDVARRRLRAQRAGTGSCGPGRPSGCRLVAALRRAALERCAGATIEESRGGSLRRADDRRTDGSQRLTRVPARDNTASVPQQHMGADPIRTGGGGSVGSQDRLVGTGDDRCNAFNPSRFKLMAQCCKTLSVYVASRLPSFIRPARKRLRTAADLAACGKSAASADAAWSPAWSGSDRRACSPDGTTNGRGAWRCWS